MTVDEIGMTVAEWARSESLIRRVYLFGSRARETHRPDSDADLAILHDLDPETLASCDGPMIARVLMWMDHEKPWTAALQSQLSVTVHLHATERVSRQRVWPSLKECRVCLYRRATFKL